MSRGMINLKKRLRLIYVKWLVWRGKAVDIGSKGAYPAGVLSNFTPYTFSFRGTDFVSMEALLQGLKFNPNRSLGLISSDKNVVF